MRPLVNEEYGLEVRERAIWFVRESMPARLMQLVCSVAHRVSRLLGHQELLESDPAPSCQQRMNEH